MLNSNIQSLLFFIIIPLVLLLGSCTSSKVEFETYPSKYNIFNVRKTNLHFGSGDLYHMNKIFYYGSFSFPNYLLYEDNKIKEFSAFLSCDRYYDSSSDYCILEQLFNCSRCWTYIYGDSSAELNECDIVIQTFLDLNKKTNDTLFSSI